MQLAILLSNITIIALILVGGFWLRQVVNQQLAAKDAVIEVKNAVIETKDARIEDLAAKQAPTIVKQLNEMIQFVEKTQNESWKKDQQLAELRSNLQQMLRRSDAPELFGFIQGCLEGYYSVRLLWKDIGVKVATALTQKRAPGPEELFARFEPTMDGLGKEALEALNGKMPELKFTEEFVQLKGNSPETRNPKPNE